MGLPVRAGERVELAVEIVGEEEPRLERNLNVCQWCEADEGRNGRTRVQHERGSTGSIRSNTLGNKRQMFRGSAVFFSALPLRLRAGVMTGRLPFGAWRGNVFTRFVLLNLQEVLLRVAANLKQRSAVGQLKHACAYLNDRLCLH